MRRCCRAASTSRATRLPNDDNGDAGDTASSKSSGISSPLRMLSPPALDEDPSDDPSEYRRATELSASFGNTPSDPMLPCRGDAVSCSRCKAGLTGDCTSSGLGERGTGVAAVAAEAAGFDVVDAALSRPRGCPCACSRAGSSAGHVHSSLFRLHPLQTGFSSLHFFLRRRQVKQPVLLRMMGTALIVGDGA